MSTEAKRSAQVKWRAKNSEKLRAAQVAWQQSEQGKAWRKRYHSKQMSDPAFREKERLRSLERNRRSKAEVLAAYGGHWCSCCDESNVWMLTLDHINGDGAKHRRQLQSRGGVLFYRKLKRLGYPSGYRVLCFNCNAAIHLNGGICPHKQKH